MSKNVEFWKLPSEEFAFNVVLNLDSEFFTSPATTSSVPRKKYSNDVFVMVSLSTCKNVYEEYRTVKVYI